MAHKRIITWRNAHLLLLLIIAALMPFAMNLISYALILWFITGLVVFIRERKTLPRVKMDKGLIFLFLYYALVLAGIFWSQNKAAAWFDAQVKLSLLILPIPVLLLRSLYASCRNMVLLVFVLANVVAGLTCMVVALYHSLHFGPAGLSFDPTVPGIYEDVNTAPSSYFAYTDFSIFKHPAYFSMYLTMSVFFMIHLVFSGYKPVKHKGWRWLLIVVIFLVLFTSIYFLQSKAGYASLFVLLFIAAFIYLVRKRKWFYAVAAMILIGALGFVWMRTNSRFYYIREAIGKRSEFAVLVRNGDYRKMIDEYGIDRIPLWMVTARAGTEYFWTGCGSGDVHDVLNAKFKEYRLWELEAKKYNAHNQFLETFLAIGIFGLLFLLGWLFLPLFYKRTWQSGGWILAVFLGLLVLNYFFESMLNSFAGVIFTAYFYTLFVGTEMLSFKSSPEKQ